MNALRLNLALILLISLILPLGCSPRAPESAQLEPPMVRVRLLDQVNRVNVTCAQPPVVVTDTGQTRRRLGVSPGQTVVITLAGERWQINGADAGAGEMEIQQPQDGSASIDGAPYRGSFRLVPVAAGRFDVVNHVDTEQYLRGVLAKELFADWHESAYRAQAIIARTYALYEVKTNPKARHFDLFPDERSQVYGGMNAETAKASAAVEATRGYVVGYGPTGQERIFCTFFSSCCGGKSAAAGDAFGGPTVPPLDARDNGTTCSISTRYAWGPIALSKNELTRRLRLWGERNGHAIANMAPLQRIDVAMVNRAGRPSRYLVTDASGQSFSLLGEQMRWALNTDAGSGPTVYSSYLSITDAGTELQVAGHGFGHGVGACQWCMQAQALAGLDHATIVTRNFPGAKVIGAY